MNFILLAAGSVPHPGIVLQCMPHPINQPRTTDHLIFTSGATLPWGTPQTVTVSGVDDHADDGDVEFAINFDPTESDDVRYKGRGACSGYRNFA